MEAAGNYENFYWITNPIIENDMEILPVTGNYILLYGNLNSTVMKKSFDLFCEQIYPEICQSLGHLNVKILIIGTGNTQYYDQVVKKYNCSLVEILGEVTSIKQFIASSRLVLFPVNSFGGTLTRLMEVIECRVSYCGNKSCGEASGARAINSKFR